MIALSPKIWNIVCGCHNNSSILMPRKTQTRFFRVLPAPFLHFVQERSIADTKFGIRDLHKKLTCCRCWDIHGLNFNSCIDATIPLDSNMLPTFENRVFDTNDGRL